MLQKTTTALLDGLADGSNQEIWEEFDARLRPVLVGFAVRLGLGQADAADAAQETLTRFVEAYRAGKFDRSRGRLHSWILGIARNCVREQWDRSARRGEARGMSAIEMLPAEDAMSRLWGDEWRRAILRRAIDRLRDETKTTPATVRVLELLALEGRTPEEAGREVGLTTDEVYVAKHRTLKRLRGLMEELAELYEVGSLRGDEGGEGDEGMAG